MTGVLSQRTTHPVAPAAALLAAGAAVLATAPVLGPAVPAVAWTLLGATAGYSISGSV